MPRASVGHSQNRRICGKNVWSLCQNECYLTKNNMGADSRLQPNNSSQSLALKLTAYAMLSTWQGDEALMPEFQPQHIPSYCGCEKSCHFSCWLLKVLSHNGLLRYPQMSQVPTKERGAPAKSILQMNGIALACRLVQLGWPWNVRKYMIILL